MLVRVGDSRSRTGRDGLLPRYAGRRLARICWTNIRENGEADLDHSLNTMDLDSLDGLAHSYTGDQYRQDMFFRYNQTFQYFFDQSARVETEFGE